jgi:hypothetical protein
MNRSLPFGYHIIGRINVVKLNVNLNYTDAITLETKYKNIVTESTGRKSIRRIEGTITSQEFQGFLKDLELYKLDFKVSKLLEKKANLLDNSISTKIADLNDLPF